MACLAIARAASTKGNPHPGRVGRISVARLRATGRTRRRRAIRRDAGGPGVCPVVPAGPPRRHGHPLPPLLWRRILTDNGDGVMHSAMGKLASIVAGGCQPVPPLVEPVVDIACNPGGPVVAPMAWSLTWGRGQVPETIDSPWKNRAGDQRIEGRAERRATGHAGPNPCARSGLGPGCSVHFRCYVATSSLREGPNW